MSKAKTIKIDDWVLCPLTKDDIAMPTIVAKVVKIEDNIVTIEIKNGTVTIPKKMCRVVYVQNIN
jgi:hypothetical protein